MKKWKPSATASFDYKTISFIVNEVVAFLFQQPKEVRRRKARARPLAPLASNLWLPDEDRFPCLLLT